MSSPLGKVSGLAGLDWSFLNVDAHENLDDIEDDIDTPRSFTDVSSGDRSFDWGDALSSSITSTSTSSTSTSSTSSSTDTSLHFDFEASLEQQRVESSSLSGGKRKDYTTPPLQAPTETPTPSSSLALTGRKRKTRSASMELETGCGIKTPHSSSSSIVGKQPEESSSSAPSTPLRKKSGNLFHAIQGRSLNRRNVQAVSYFHSRQKYGKVDPRRPDIFNNELQRIPPKEFGISDFKVAMGKTNAYFYNNKGTLVCFDRRQWVPKWDYPIVGTAGSSLRKVNVVSEITPTRIFALGAEDNATTVLQIIGFNNNGAYFVREIKCSDTNQYSAAVVGNTIFTKYGKNIRQLDEEFNVLAIYQPPRGTTSGLFRRFIRFGDELVVHDEQTIAIYNQDPAVPPQVFSIYNKKTRITAIHVDDAKIVCGLKRNFAVPSACCVIQRESYPLHPRNYPPNPQEKGTDYPNAVLESLPPETQDPVKFIDASSVFSVETNPYFATERKKKKLNKSDYVQMEIGDGFRRTLIKGTINSIAVRGNTAYLGDSSGIVAAVDLSENDTSHCLHRHDGPAQFLSISNQILASADDTEVALSDIGPFEITKQVFYKSIPIWNHAEPSNWTVKSLTVDDDGVAVIMDNKDLDRGSIVPWQFKTFLPKFQEDQEDFQQGGRRVTEVEEDSTRFVEEENPANFLAQQAAALAEFADQKEDEA